MDAQEYAIRQATVAYAVTGFGFVLMAFLAVYFFTQWQPKKITCALLKQNYGDSTYKHALDLLPTNPQLDRDHDGKPCETLMIK